MTQTLPLYNITSIRIRFAQGWYLKVINVGSITLLHCVIKWINENYKFECVMPQQLYPLC